MDASTRTDDLGRNDNVGERIAKESTVVSQVDDVLPVGDCRRKQTIERIISDIEESQTDVGAGQQPVEVSRKRTDELVVIDLKEEEIGMEHSSHIRNDADHLVVVSIESFEIDKRVHGSL